MSPSPASRLETIRKLAMMPGAGLPIGLNALSMTPEGVPSISGPPRPSKLNFVVDGLPFHAAVNPQGEGATCQIWAEVGHIPYTAQSPERRQRLLALLARIQGLVHARFVIQDGQKILLVGERRFEGAVSPTDLIHHIVLVLHEARPFLRLLGDSL